MPTHTFRVHRESYGWTLTLGETVTGVFRSRPRAVEQAYWLCSQLRTHGAHARVLVDPV